MKVLVVDDEGIVLDSCTVVLEDEGYEVLSVASAREAEKLCKTIEPALCIIDVKMPERDGMSLMQTIKTRWPDKPVIVMSGYATPETIHEAEEKGCAAFLAKPFTPDELMQKVRQVMHKEA